MENLRAIDSELFKDVVTVYDQNKTTLFGDMLQLLIGGKNTLTPTPMKYLDTVADTGVTALMPEASGDYIFSIQGTATPFSVLCYYAPKNLNTKTYIGRVSLTTGSGTSVLRAFKPHVNGNDVVIGFLTTNATAANSGLYVTTQLKLTDFTSSGTTLTLAGIGETSALKRVFKLEETNVNGGAATHQLIAANELFIDPTNGYFYAKNGSAATYQIYRFKYDVLLTSTSALGQTTDAFTGLNGFKTGNLPALAGTVLQNNAGRIANLNAASGAVVANQGANNFVFATTTTIYYGLISDLAASVTTWPSLQNVNLSGASGDQVNPTTLSFFAYSTVLNRCVFFTNGRFYMKRLINNQFESILGCTDSQFLENQLSKTPVLGTLALTGMEIGDGVLWITSSTTGQRGLLGVNLRNDAQFDYSYFITKVMPLNRETLISLNVSNALRGISSSSQIWYRTSGFGTATGGWIQLPDDFDLSTLSSLLANQIQFKVYSYITKNGNAIAPAIFGLRLITRPLAANDREWVNSFKHTSASGASPFYVSFRLQYAYQTLPTNFRVDILDDADNVLLTFNTSANAANFSYTTNDGATWLPWGTMPNTALTTELRCLVPTPPGGKVRARIREL